MPPQFLICDSQTATTEELKIKNKNDDEPNPAAKPQSKVSRTTLLPEGNALPGERRRLTEGSAILRGAHSDRKLRENSEATEARRRADEHEMPSNLILCQGG